MNISNGARKLLEGRMNGERDTDGRTTSISDRKGGICVTRVFRSSGGADEWMWTIRDECMAPGGGEISIRKMAVPDPAGSGEDILVVAASAPGILLRDEPGGRIAYTPGGVTITELAESPAEVEVSCERDPLGFINGTVRYDGKSWTARIRGCTPEGLVTENDLLGHRIFRNINDALEAVDQMVEAREQREMDRRKEKEQLITAAGQQIDGIFAAGLREGEEK